MTRLWATTWKKDIWRKNGKWRKKEENIGKSLEHFDGTTFASHMQTWESHRQTWESQRKTLELKMSSTPLTIGQVQQTCNESSGIRWSKVQPKYFAPRVAQKVDTWIFTWTATFSECNKNLTVLWATFAIICHLDCLKNWTRVSEVKFNLWSIL